MNLISWLDNSLFIKLNLWPQNGLLDKFLATVALYTIYIIPVILIILWFWSEHAKKTAFRAAVAGLLAWLGFCNLIGAFYFRPRPFDNGNLSVNELIFHRPDRSFPSDHAAFLFALAFIFLFLGYRKLGLSFFVMAIAISLTRIIVGVHYPSDVLAGLGIGLIAAALIWFFRHQVDFIFNKVRIVAKKLRLG